MSDKTNIEVKDIVVQSPAEQSVDKRAVAFIREIVALLTDKPELKVSRYSFEAPRKYNAGCETIALEVDKDTTITIILQRSV